MFLARVTKRVVAVAKHSAYENRSVFIVQPVRPDGSSDGDEWVAMDYVNAGVGDTVVCGGAPGVATTIFGIDRAPIRTLIMAIVDHIEWNDLKAPPK